MFSSPMLYNQVGKWMLVLTEFSLHFVLVKAIKGQVLADFLVNHPGLEIEEVSLVKVKPWFKPPKWCRCGNSTRISYG